jgi:putative membrane protein
MVVGLHIAWIVSLFFLMMVLAGVALLVIWAVRARPLSPAGQAPGRETPLDILARRFAAGEIDADEYKRSRDLLSGGGSKT